MNDNIFAQSSISQFTQQQSTILDRICLLERIHNEFHLSPEDANTHLSKYYLLRWQGEYIIQQMVEAENYRKNGSCIIHQDTTYRVNFLNVSPWQLVTQKQDQFFLSFRLPKDSKIGTCILKKAG